MVEQLTKLIAHLNPGTVITPTALQMGVARGVVGIPSIQLRELISNPSGLSGCIAALDPLREIVFWDDGGRFRRRRWEVSERRGGVLDLNNLLWSCGHDHSHDAFSLQPVEAIVTYLRTYGVTRLIGVADGNLPYLLADPSEITSLTDQIGPLVYPPKGRSADPTVLECAEATGGLIISNDRFRQWRKSSGWRKRHLWRLRLPFLPHVDGEGTLRYLHGEYGAELEDPPPTIGVGE